MYCNIIKIFDYGIPIFYNGRQEERMEKEKFGDEYEKLLLNFLNCNVDIKQAPGKASLLQDDFG